MISHRSLSFNQLKSERQLLVFSLTAQFEWSWFSRSNTSWLWVMWSLRAWNSQTQLQYSYTSSIYEGCTQMWGIIKTPARLLKCYAVFGVLAQLSTFPELLPLTKTGLLANKLNRPTQGLFSSAEWLGPSGPTANGSLNINLCPHVSAVYRLYFISNPNNKCEALYLKTERTKDLFSSLETQINLFGSQWLVASGAQCLQLK